VEAFWRNYPIVQTTFFFLTVASLLASGCGTGSQLAETVSEEGANGTAGIYMLEFFENSEPAQQQVPSGDSSVPNHLFGTGRTMADLIAECAAVAPNHGEFVSCVARLTNDWPNAGLITERQRGRVMSYASRNRSLFVCAQPFAPDGDIGEFINFHGDSQNYFVTDVLDGLRFGELREGVDVCDRIVIARDDSPVWGTPNAAGPTGFGDAPRLSWYKPIPTGFNIGRVFVHFAPTADPDRNPENGTGVYFVALDISAPGGLDFLAGTQPIAFDVDGDGSRQTETEMGGYFPEAPLKGVDSYFVRLYTDADGAPDVTIVIGETVDQLPHGAVAIDPDGQPQRIDDYDVFRFLWLKLGRMPGTDAEVLQFLDCNQDGSVDEYDVGVDADLEMAILNVTALPGNSNPYRVRFQILAVSPNDQGSPSDFMGFEGVFPEATGDPTEEYPSAGVRVADRAAAIKR